MIAPPTVILVEPSLPENIGATARAMRNFGLTELRLVRPQRRWPHPRAEATAAGADDVLDRATLHPTLADAIADLHLAFGTTAIPRDLVKRWMGPEAAVAALRQAGAEGLRTGLVFGPERTGLLNDDVAALDALVRIPTLPEFDSLNLAQAVVILAHEWRRAERDPDPPMLEAGRARPAAKAELEAFALRLEAELDACGFFRVPDKRPSMVRNLRALFGRMDLTVQELRTLHGVITELVTRRVSPGGPPAPKD